VDKITLKGMEFFGYHGVGKIERQRGQIFIIDVVMHVDLSQACLTDQLDKTVDYSFVLKEIERIVEGKPYYLIEKVAAVVSDNLLEKFPLIESVEVVIHKPDAPMDGIFDDVSISIERSRHD